MFYQYTIRFTFRTGQIFTIYTNNLVIDERGKSNKHVYIDGVAVANVKKSNANVFKEGEFYYYNAFPLPAFFDMLPEDWDKNQPALRLIDEIYVNTKGVQNNER